VIIVISNLRELLRSCPNSIYERRDEIGHEISVVDNAKGNDSAKMVENAFLRVIPIGNIDNCVFAKANNQSTAIAKGRYILLLNGDTLVLSQVIAKMESFADDAPDAAVVDYTLLNPKKTSQPMCFICEKAF
jgi:GT2 family glycosyltransferase